MYAHPYIHYFIVIYRYRYIVLMVVPRDGHLEKTEGIEKVKGADFSGRRVLFRAVSSLGHRDWHLS